MKMLFISALTVGISFLSFAEPKETLMEVTSVRNRYEKVRVTFKEPMNKVFISILDSEGRMIVKSKYKTKEPTTVPYDLSHLPTGEYQIKIETEDETALYNITTVEKKIIERPLMAYGKFKARDTITLLVVGLEKPGVTVEIYNELGKIRKEFIDVPEGFSRDYKFVNQKAGKIYFRLKDAQGRIKYVYPRAQ
ncbi:MAG: T9SS type A sorting domain-containing protein [Anditalea sp.]